MLAISLLGQLPSIAIVPWIIVIVVVLAYATALFYQHKNLISEGASSQREDDSAAESSRTDQSVRMSKQEAEAMFSAWDVPDASRQSKGLDQSELSGQKIASWREKVSELEKGVEEANEDEIPMLAELSKQIQDVSDQLRSTLGNNTSHNLFHRQYIDLQTTKSRLLYAETMLDATISSSISSRTSHFLRRTATLQQEMQEIVEEYEPGDNIEYELTQLRAEASEVNNDVERFESEVRTIERHSPTVDLTVLTDNLASVILRADFWVDFAPVCERLASLDSATQPYSEYDVYLEHRTNEELQQRLDEALLKLDTLERTHAINLLPEESERFEEALRRVSEIRQLLANYNTEFITRQRESNRWLFNGIGDSGISLDTQQQQAVIRNDDYNLVIAGAGSGKTVTLTTRVAYLVYVQGIAPERIAVVTFTREAKAEMERRLADNFEITSATVETIHAFANSVIHDKLDNPPDVIDNHQIENIIDRRIRAAKDADDEEFLNHYYEFLVHFEDVYLQPESYESKEEYFRQRAEQQYTTLKGEEIKSRAEKRIADFLFMHQVDYRYEDLATWAETADDKSTYEPDFYLPNYDIYIEHWGIDDAGEIAPYFSWSSEEYREKIRWARNEFANSNSVLIETYEFEQEGGHLHDALRARLRSAGVDLNRMNLTELINSTFDYDRREGFIKKRFKDFIINAKRFDIKTNKITDVITKDHKRQYHFAKCGILLLQDYEQFRTEEQLIDFPGMIDKALEIIRRDESEPFGYDHILVDEFQDIGVGVVDLIQEIAGPSDAKLFAVGDDWQSIYSFQGAVVENFIDFDSRFPHPAQTTLRRNYRCPNKIIEAGSAVIEQNDNQLPKTVSGVSDREGSITVTPLDGYQFSDYVDQVATYTHLLVEQYLQDGATPDDIMILCRFDGAVPLLDEVKERLASNAIPYVGKNDSFGVSNLDVTGAVSVYSLYQAKGREADHVILLHLVEGTFGFPPDGRENELLEPVKPVDPMSKAEERRAFYVALTRSKQSVDILTRNEHESEFLDDISEHTTVIDDAERITPLGSAGTRTDIVARVKHTYDDVHPKKHQDGVLVDRFGGSARFISWESTSPPTLDEDIWYRINDARVDEFNDRKELIIGDESTVSEIDSFVDDSSQLPQQLVSSQDQETDSLPGGSSTSKADTDDSSVSDIPHSSNCDHHEDRIQDGDQGSSDIPGNAGHAAESANSEVGSREASSQDSHITEQDSMNISKDNKIRTSQSDGGQVCTSCGAYIGGNYSECPNCDNSI